MTRPFQWGIVGTGGIARHFAADLSLLPDASLAGICSRDVDKAKAFQSAFGAVRAPMPTSTQWPPIRISTRSTSRPPMRCMPSRHCASSRRGKAVLVEKPLATSVADAERIASAAAEQKCFVMEAMWTRFLPAVRAAKKLVDGGAIGKVTGYRRRAFLSPRRRCRQPLLRPGSSAAARHSISASIPCRWRCISWANPQKFRGGWHASKSGVDMRSEFNLKFAGGATARLSCGFDRDGANQFVIEGSEGVLRLDAPFLKAQRLTQFSPKAFAMGCRRVERRSWPRS